jgi:DNA polymerase I-like protein with 3'-5' exonuclease and polymerase domains
MQSKSLAKHLKCSVEEAQKHITNIYRTFPDFLSWQSSVCEHLSDRCCVKTLEGTTRWFSSQFGNVFEQEKAQRQAINHCVQGLAANCFKKSAIMMMRSLTDKGFYKPFDRGCIVMPVNAVHDEIVVQCREQYVNEVSELIKTSFIEGHQHYIKTVPVKLTCAVVDKWGEAK